MAVATLPPPPPGWSTYCLSISATIFSSIDSEAVHWPICWRLRSWNRERRMMTGEVSKRPRRPLRELRSGFGTQAAAMPRFFFPRCHLHTRFPPFDLSFFLVDAAMDRTRRHSRRVAALAHWLASTSGPGSPPSPAIENGSLGGMGMSVTPGTVKLSVSVQHIVSPVTASTSEVTRVTSPPRRIAWSTVPSSW